MYTTVRCLPLGANSGKEAICGWRIAERSPRRSSSHQLRKVDRRCSRWKRIARLLISRWNWTTRRIDSAIKWQMRRSGHQARGVNASCVSSAAGRSPREMHFLSRLVTGAYAVEITADSAYAFSTLLPKLPRLVIWYRRNFLVSIVDGAFDAWHHSLQLSCKHGASNCLFVEEN